MGQDSKRAGKERRERKTAESMSGTDGENAEPLSPSVQFKSALKMGSFYWAVKIN